MKILILTSSTDIRYGRGSDRVIFNAKEKLNAEFEYVVYLSGKNIYTFCIGVAKIILNNPFSFKFIIFNAQSSIRTNANPYWKLFYVIAKVLKIKYVIYWHEMPYFVENYAKKSKFLQRVFKEDNLIQFCCSEANKPSAFFFEKNPNVQVINNCIIPRKFNKNLLFLNFTVITVGTVDNTKGADIWTDVAIDVCKQNKNIQFIWCGDVVDQKMHKDCLVKINEAQLAENITFLGKVEDAVVITAAAHLYFCSSRMDSFPLAILEAMSHGKNIIYYDSGGVVEAVGNDGIFIPEFSKDNTVNVILDKFEEFKANPQTVFNQAVYDKFYENYTPEIFVKKLKAALLNKVK